MNMGIIRPLMRFVIVPYLFSIGATIPPTMWAINVSIWGTILWRGRRPLECPRTIADLNRLATTTVQFRFNSCQRFRANILKRAGCRYPESTKSSRICCCMGHGNSRCAGCCAQDDNLVNERELCRLDGSVSLPSSSSGLKVKLPEAKPAMLDDSEVPDCWCGW